MSRRYGLKYGSRGLEFIYKLNDQVVADIPISKDIDKILTFLDLDPIKFHKGFKNRKEIFDFIIKSKNFNPYVYELGNTNKINRDRDKKRTTYKEWLEYIEPLKQSGKFESFGYWHVTRDKTAYIPFISSYFPESGLDYEVLKYKVAYEKSNTRSSKFNGNLVRAWTGLDGKSLGKIIDEFKKEKEKDNFSFGEYLDLYTREGIEKVFKAWFELKINSESEKVNLVKNNEEKQS